MATDTVGGSSAHTNNNQGAARAQAIVASAGGALSTIGYNMYAGAASERVGIYSDSSGSPGSLLAESADISSGVATGWNDVAVTGVTIVQGILYWLAIQTNGAVPDVYYNSTTPPNNKYYTQAYGPFGTGTWSAGGGCFNMRMTYTSTTPTKTYSKAFPAAGLGNFF